MSCILVIPAAGSGTRLEGAVPKAFVELAGATLLQHCLERALASGAIDAVAIAAAAGWEERAREIAAAAAAAAAHRATDEAPRAVPVLVTTGGADRVASVAAALDAAAAAFPAARVALVHDAARCLTPPSVFARVVAAVRAGSEAVVPVLPVTDTIAAVGASAAESAEEGPGGSGDGTAGAGAGAEADGVRTGAEADGVGTGAAVARIGAAAAAAGPNAAGPCAGGGVRCEPLVGNVDRTGLRRVQTPQGFALPVLRAAHAAQLADPDPSATDDTSLVARLGVGVDGVPGDERALKITYPIDMAVARALLEEGA